MNEHERIELQRLARQSGALGNQIRFTPHPVRRGSSVNWGRVAAVVAAGAAVLMFLLLVVLLPWDTAAQVIGWPSLATVMPLVRVGATPPCVLCGSTESCSCDMRALCDRSSARFQAELHDRRERDRDRHLPAGFQLIWPADRRVS